MYLSDEDKKIISNCLSEKKYEIEDNIRTINLIKYTDLNRKELQEYQVNKLFEFKNKLRDIIELMK